MMQSMSMRLFVVFTAAFALLLLVSLPQLADPLVRHDDFPALFGEEHLFYEKTLAEGRWLNYWWIARPILWEPWVNFALYQAFWALFSAAAAINAIGPDADRSYSAVVLAAIIAVSPQAFLISGWFNTLLLGNALIATFAVLNLYLSNKAARFAFLVFAPVSMMAYSTYPMLMIALLMTRHDMRRSFMDLVLLVVLLAMGIGLGMALMYTINYFHHGVFGIVISDWRSPNPATDLDSFLQNAERLMPIFAERLFSSTAFGIPAIGALNIALLVAALAILSRTNLWLAFYAIVGISVCVGVIAVHGLKEGVEVPMRALVAVWVFFAIVVVISLTNLESERWKGVAWGGLIVLVGIYGGQLFKHTALFDTWQEETRALANMVESDTEAMLMFGRMAGIPGVANAHIDHPLGLSERIRLLSGVRAFVCSEPKGDRCEGTPPFDLDAPSAELQIKKRDKLLFVRFPDAPIVQAESR